MTFLGVANHLHVPVDDWGTGTSSQTSYSSTGLMIYSDGSVHQDSCC